jgi:hypothetical protein
MKLYDEGVLMSHLETEIEKSKRYGYPFTMVVVQTVDRKSLSGVLLKSLIEAHYRSVDIVANTKPNQYTLLLNHTKAEGAAKWIARIINKAVRERNIPLVTAFAEYRDGDTKESLLGRLHKQIK